MDVLSDGMIIAEQAKLNGTRKKIERTEKYMLGISGSQSVIIFILGSTYQEIYS